MGTLARVVQASGPRECRIGRLGAVYAHRPGCASTTRTARCLDRPCSGCRQCPASGGDPQNGGLPVGQTTSWPGATHPLTPPCRAERAVPTWALRGSVGLRGVTRAPNSVRPPHFGTQALRSGGVLRRGLRPRLPILDLPPTRAGDPGPDDLGAQRLPANHRIAPGRRARLGETRARGADHDSHWDCGRSSYGTAMNQWEGR